MSLECVVCVPARNEEHRLPLLLSALASQDLPEGETLRVVVLANNCVDRTAQVASVLGEALPRLRLRLREQDWPADIANVGLARGAAMSAGVAWLREEAGEGILVSTDADAVPPPHWISAIRRGFEAGAEVVGGAIRIEEDGSPVPAWLAEARARVAAYWAAVRDLAHAIDPLPHDPPARHGDHTGASLAITLDAYQAAGGIPPIASREDVALVTAVELLGGRLRHPADVWTEVSAREDGRAEGGMAGELQRWRHFVESGEPHLVPDAPFWLEKFRRRRAFRDMFRQRAFRSEAGVPSLELMSVAARAVNDIAFVAMAEEIAPERACPMAEIGRATCGIQALLAPRAAA